MTTALQRWKVMTQRFRKWFRTSMFFAGIVIIAVTFGIAIVVLDNDIAVAILTAGSAIFVSVFSAIWSRNIERTEQIEQQIRDKKTPIYEGFIEVAFELLYSSKTNSNDLNKISHPNKSGPGQSRNLDPIEKLRGLTPKLIIWGTNEVIESWNEFRSVSANQNTDQSTSDRAHEVLYAFEQFMIEIRRDLGHKDTRIKKGDLLRTFINDIKK
jgi:hypothetical protein